MSEQRIIELEKKVAFQEVALEELNEAVELHQKRITFLENEIRIVKDKITHENPMCDLKDEEPPPHY